MSSCIFMKPGKFFPKTRQKSSITLQKHVDFRQNFVKKWPFSIELTPFRTPPAASLGEVWPKFAEGRVPLAHVFPQLSTQREKEWSKIKNLQPNSTFLGCPLGYHSAVNNWTCYNGYDTPLSFSDAQTACKNTWSNLVTINNAFENSDLAGKKLSFFNNI